MGNGKARGELCPAIEMIVIQLAIICTILRKFRLLPVSVHFSVHVSVYIAVHNLYQNVSISNKRFVDILHILDILDILHLP